MILILKVSWALRIKNTTEINEYLAKLVANKFTSNGRQTYKELSRNMKYVNIHIEDINMETV